MSMRTTFTTNFIYDGFEGFEERRQKMIDILSEGERQPAYSSNGSMIGQIAGINRGLDLTESDIKRWIEEQCYELSKITAVSFKIAYLLEGSDIIIKEINPSHL